MLGRGHTRPKKNYLSSLVGTSNPSSVTACEASSSAYLMYIYTGKNQPRCACLHLYLQNAKESSRLADWHVVQYGQLFMLYMNLGNTVIRPISLRRKRNQGIDCVPCVLHRLHVSISYVRPDDDVIEKPSHRL